MYGLSEKDRAVIKERLVAGSDALTVAKIEAAVKILSAIHPDSDLWDVAAKYLQEQLTTADKPLEISDAV